MTSVAPSPDSPVAALPNSTAILSPPTSSVPPTDNSTTSAPPSTQPNASSDPPPPATPTNSSSPPPQSPPPSVPSAPPPAVSLSPPPPAPVVPPPEVSTTPALPPPPTTTPVPNPPSAPPPAPSSPVVSPPPPNRAPPPVSTSPPVVNAPPPEEVSTPSPPPPVVSSPPSNSPPQVPSSPPPPLAANNSPPPLPSDSPPPPLANPPEVSPAPPTTSPPPVSQPTSPAPPASPPATSPPPTNQTQPTPSIPSPPTVGPSQNNSQTGPPRNDTGGSSLVPTQPIPSEPNGTTNTGSEAPVNGNSTNSGGMNTSGAVAIGVIVGFVVLGFIGVALWFWRKQKRKVTGYHAGHVMPSPLGSSPVSDTSYIKAHSSAPLMASRSGSQSIYSPPESGVFGNSRSVFTYEELVEATDGFSTQNLLGEGGFGCVYKGNLTDGREVAVKQLKIGGSQGEREFSAEVETISRVHHRHLVSLVGYCISEHQRLLVYDYVSNNTLYYHLHGDTGTVMDWPTRVKVATGAARGISYLHEDCHPRIIHRDIKSSNILLDDSFDAQVADFGLAKLTSDIYTHISTRVMGTFGYMAPEYASSGKLTDRSDVYSFGVVLLELITGRKPVDESQPMGDESLVEWARPLMNDAIANQEIGELIDPRLENNYVETEVFRMIEAAAACVRHSATKRPRMGQVVRALDAIDVTADLTNGIKPGQSEVFNSAQQSAEIRMFQRMAFGTQDYSSDIFSQSSFGS